MKMIEGFNRGSAGKDRSYDRAGLGYYNKDYSDRKVTRLINALHYSPTSDQCNKGEIVFLHDFVKKIGGGRIANLGCHRGGSAGAMAYALKETEFGPAFDGRVYTVDVYRGTLKQTAQRHFDTIGVSDLIEVCKGQTNTWANLLRKRFGKESFDFVFVDAGHSKVACSNDIQDWAPLIKPGGAMGFHDIQLNSVHECMEELDRAQWKKIEHCLLIKVFQKLR